MDRILESLLSHNVLLVYSVLFVLIFLENTIPFVPGDLVLVFTAYLSGRTALLPVPAYCITVIGSLAGFVFIFLLSRNWRQDIYRRLPFRFSKERIHRYRSLFKKHEDWSLVIGRIIPGSRLFLSATAGFMEISIFKAAALTLLGVLVWNTVIFHFGMLLGENWDAIQHTLKEYSNIVNILTIFLVGVFLLWRYYRLKTYKTHE